MHETVESIVWMIFGSVLTIGAIAFGLLRERVDKIERNLPAETFAMRAKNEKIANDAKRDR